MKKSIEVKTAFHPIRAVIPANKKYCL